MGVSFTSWVGRRLVLTPVTIIHKKGEPDESRDPLECQCLANAGYFDIDAPVDEGDHVEIDDPRTGGKMDYYVESVELNRSPIPRIPSYIEAKWGKPSSEHQPSVVHHSTTITVTGDHNTVAAGVGSIALAQHISQEGPPEYRALSASVASILESLAGLDVGDDERAAVLDAVAPLLHSLEDEAPDPSAVRRLAVGLKNAVAGLAHGVGAGASAGVAAFTSEHVHALLDHIASLG